MSAHILIVEDESGIRQLITFGLAEDDYRFSEAKSLKNANLALSESKPDLIILDWMLPDGNGITLLRELRQRKATAKLPIIMLTARSSEEDIIKGLDNGADDYLTKPFSVAELKARVSALLRRSGSEEETTLTYDIVTLDTDSHEVQCNGQPIELHRREYQLLATFIAQPGKVHQREQLLEKVWGEYADVGDRAVDVAIRRLRKAFEEAGYDLPLTTIRGVGYKLDKITD